MIGDLAFLFVRLGNQAAVTYHAKGYKNIWNKMEQPLKALQYEHYLTRLKNCVYQLASTLT
jgi:heterodisulfide reductase subunit B